MVHLKKEMLAKDGSRSAAPGKGRLENGSNNGILKHPFSKYLRIGLGATSGSWAAELM